VEKRTEMILKAKRKLHTYNVDDMKRILHMSLRNRALSNIMTPQESELEMCPAAPSIYSNPKLEEV
jgi:hypothetical protein